MITDAVSIPLKFFNFSGFKIKKDSLISSVTSSYTKLILLEAPDERMTDEEFAKAMRALEEIWSVCPENIPKDLSTKHDYYLK